MRRGRVVQGLDDRIVSVIGLLDSLRRGDGRVALAPQLFDLRVRGVQRHPASVHAAHVVAAVDNRVQRLRVGDRHLHDAHGLDPRSRRGMNRRSGQYQDAQQGSHDHPELSLFPSVRRAKAASITTNVAAVHGAIGSGAAG